MKDSFKRIPSAEIRQYLKKVETGGSFSESIADDLEESVFGQREACLALARMVARYETGLTLPDKPAGVVIFLGPTGVGKTEMSRALSRYMFGYPDSSQLKVIDCAEFSEAHSVHRFLGSPPSYVGYGDELMIEEEFLGGRNIIVFDEIEKADPALWRMLLSVFSTGSLSVRAENPEGRGAREVRLDFSNSFIILTSNVGAWEMQNEGNTIGFLGESRSQDIDKAALGGLKKCFGHIPEFLGRIDEKIVFKPLSDENYVSIYWKFIGEINEYLKSGITFTTSDELTKHLIALSVANKQFGARDMEHVIKSVLLQPLSDVLAIEPVTTFIIGDLDEEGKIVFYMY